VSATTLVLARHGQAQVNADRRMSARPPGSPLTELGRQQAGDLGARLAEAHPVVDAVYASPLLRARQTAEIVAKAFGLNPIERPEIAEVDIGILEGTPGNDATILDEPAFAQWVHRRGLDRSMAGGELGSDMLRRFQAFLDDVVREHAGGTVVAVTHGGLMAAGVPNVVPAGAGGGDAEVSIPVNCAVIELAHTGGHWRL